jgi:hypothetical protein
VRHLLGLALVVCTTVLACHGVFSEDTARASIGEVSVSTTAALEAAVAAWPYSRAVIPVREELLSRTIAAHPGHPPVRPDPDYASERVREAFRSTPPFIDPPGAAAIGLLGLLLAVLLPGTRLRGTALLVLLAGTTAAMPLFLDAPSQVGLTAYADFARSVIAHQAWVAAALVALAGLLIGPRRAARGND